MQRGPGEGRLILVPRYSAPHPAREEEVAVEEEVENQVDDRNKPVDFHASPSLASPGVMVS